MKTPLTIKRIQQHFTYSWWKYALVAACAILFWNLAFTMTTPQVPQELRVTTYIYGYGDQPAMDEYLQTVRASDLPEMQLVNTIFTPPDEANGPMILMAHVVAGEGDVYIFSKEHYQSYAAQGLFVPLEDWVAAHGITQENGTDLERAWRKDSETGERHLYGLPLKFLPGLSRFIYVDPSEYYISIAVNGGNVENCFRLLDVYERDMRQAPEAE